MTLFVRAWDQNKFISNSYQHAVPKFSEVIIINYQRLSDKHVLKNKFKIKKTTFKILTIKIQNNITLCDYIQPPFQCSSATTWSVTSKGSYYATLSGSPKMSGYLKNFARKSNNVARDSFVRESNDFQRLSMLLAVTKSDCYHFFHQQLEN